MITIAPLTYAYLARKEEKKNTNGAFAIYEYVVFCRHLRFNALS